MKTRYIPAILMLLAALSGCRKDDSAAPEGGEIETVFTASLPAETKAYLDGESVRWQSGDAVCVMDKGRSSRVTVSDITDGGRKATVTAAVTAGEQVYAVLPYSDAVSLSKSTVKAVIPAEQDGTFSGAHISVAKADGAALQFNNAVALLSFNANAYSYARYVRISPVNSGENLAGVLAVKFNPDLSTVLDSDKSSSVLVTLPSGTAYAGVYAGYFKRGLSFEVLDASQTVIKTITCENALSMSPGELYEFGDLSKHEPSDPPAPSEPFMTETFSKCTASGGNDGNYSAYGSVITSPNSKTDCAGWQMSQCREANGCIFLDPTATGTAYAISPTINVSGSASVYKLSLRVAGFNNGSYVLGCIEVVGSGGVDYMQMFARPAEWGTVECRLTGITSGSRLKFSVNDDLAYIDDIKITEDSGEEFKYLNVEGGGLTYNVPAEAGEYEVAVKTNCNDISVAYNTAPAYWDIYDDVVKVKVPANTSTGEKDHKVQIASSSAGATYMVHFIQAGASPTAN